MVSIGGRNLVEREPETAELELVLGLVINGIVNIEPVGDCILDRSGSDRAIGNLPVNTS